jgi:hypothetical protein
MQEKRCKARQKLCVGNLALLFLQVRLPCGLGKSKCAKLGIAKTFSLSRRNEKSGGKKKLKTSIVFVVCFYLAIICKLFCKTVQLLKSLGALLITFWSFA